jgi:hypothetical protein
MRHLPIYLTVAATVAFAGCSSSKTGTTASTATTGTTAITVSQCATAQLAASLGQSNGAMGTIYYPLNLRNTSSSKCTIQGYAGVSFVAGPDNHQVGQAASQDPRSTPTVTLSPGQTASARLGIVNAGNFPPDCNMTPVSGLRVSPPGQTASQVIDHAATACANPKYTTLHVGPFASA